MPPPPLVLHPRPVKRKVFSALGDDPVVENIKKRQQIRSARLKKEAERQKASNFITIDPLNGGINDVTLKQRSEVLYENVLYKLRSIEVTPTDMSLMQGGAKQFIAIGSFDNTESEIALRGDITKFVTWSSDNTKVAAFDLKKPGSITALTKGDASVTAKLNDVTSEAQTLSVITFDDLK